MIASERRILECLRYAYGYALSIGDPDSQADLEAAGLICRPPMPRDAAAIARGDHWLALTPAGRAQLDWDARPACSG